MTADSVAFTERRVIWRLVDLQVGREHPQVGGEAGRGKFLGLVLLGLPQSNCGRAVMTHTGVTYSDTSVQADMT